MGYFKVHQPFLVEKILGMEWIEMNQVWKNFRKILGKSREKFQENVSGKLLHLRASAPRP